MVLDNYDNSTKSDNPDRSAVDVRQLLPGCDHGLIIITTRSSQVTQAKCIQVHKLLKIQDGMQILSNIFERKGIVNIMSLWYIYIGTHSTNIIDPTTIELVEGLLYLPQVHL